MKKLLITASLLIIVCLSYGQVFVGTNFNNKGIGAELGVLSESKVNVSLGFNAPLVKANTPTLLHLSLGYEVELNDNDGENFYLLPSVGVARFKYKDFTDYSKGGSIIEVKGTALMPQLELGKQWYKGKLFARISYCNNVMYGIGIKGLF